MSLLSAPGVGVAPRFHLPVDWSGRLRVGSGLEWRDGAILPRGPWRVATDAEVAALTAGEGEQRPPAELLTLPNHLADRWWGLLERQHEAGGGPLAGFDEFSRAVCEFLAFKGVAVPEGAVCDLLVGAPGQATVRWDGGTGMGLACNVPEVVAWPAMGPLPLRPRVAINLGEEPAAVILAGPLPCHREPFAACGGEPLPRTFGELAGAVLAGGTRPMPVRLDLGPGEGISLAGGLLVGGCTEGREEPDVLLVVRDPE